MKLKTKKISLSEINVVPSEIDDREMIRELSKHIGVDALHVILALHPISLHEVEPNSYHIISGEQQLRLARALFGNDFVVTVQIISDKVDSSIASLTETLIAPLLLSVPVSELRKRAKFAKKDSAIFHLGRNFNLDSTWDSLVGELHKNRNHLRKVEKMLDQMEPVASLAVDHGGELDESLEETDQEKS